ncbi:16207_t:CDS:1 [Dentiscutata erythropus]|uniref:16207_t:CDS:1 n=1 Tax=Dentiscutata erythropus TaxID=1348616 RepID=A0A9N9FIP6_9GLOM|nr:16207_t:CDS:1 [Dentiscutata erythropus]
MAAYIPNYTDYFNINHYNYNYNPGIPCLIQNIQTGMPSQGSQPKKHSDPEKKTRFYVKQACTNCRAKKEKCSGEEKCSNCIRRNKECIYVSSGKKRGPKPKEPLKPTLSNILN